MQFDHRWLAILTGVLLLVWYLRGRSRFEAPLVQRSFKLVGKVTTALRECDVGDLIGFRGPYGNSFPLEDMRGKHLVFVGGGIGMAPVRSIVEFCLDHDIVPNEPTVGYGTKSDATDAHFRLDPSYIKKVVAK